MYLSKTVFVFPNLSSKFETYHSLNVENYNFGYVVKPDLIEKSNSAGQAVQ